ncbi:hypothetical protein [Candidatus Bathycorpusculum sp.]|uniref:hypothetical protein n=1 Tax=Candidatus Bathycorpusculum sp. TaxID=2994959 RepID=UPI0028342686|nr:hypothetical protein [Candidatus Termitimicrobium sp.]
MTPKPTTLSPIVFSRTDKEFTVTYRQKTPNSPLYIYKGPLAFEYAKVIRIKHALTNTAVYGLTVVNKCSVFKNLPVVWLTTQEEA